MTTETCAVLNKPEENITEGFISGPWGSAPVNSLAGTLNAAVRNEHVPLTTVERFMVSSDEIKVGGTTVARFKCFTGVNTPLFMWLGEEFSTYRKPRLISDDDGKIKIEFRLTLSCHQTACLEVSGEYATPVLHAFLRRMLTNWTTDPCYQIHQDAGAFFQGGSHDPNGGWFLIEFWNAAKAQVFIDYLNKNYDPDAEIDY